MNKRQLCLLVVLGLVSKTTIANDVDIPSVDDNQAMTKAAHKIKFNGSIYSQDRWKFVELLLVTQPEKTANQLNAHVLSWLMIAAKTGAIVAPITLGGWFAWKSFLNTNDFFIRGNEYEQKNSLFKKYGIESHSTKLQTITNKKEKGSLKDKIETNIGAAAIKWALINGISATVIGIAGPVIAYKTLKHFVERQCNYNALKQFIKNWEIYKQWTPVELHEICDDLFAEQSNRELTRDSEEEIEIDLTPAYSVLMQQIQQLVRDKYPEKYTYTMNRSSLIKWTSFATLGITSIGVLSTIMNSYLN